MEGRYSGKGLTMQLNVVLVEPEIPQNTGNIARTCAAVNASLHLIEPLGFSTDDKYLKRAGLDYWHMVKVEYHKNLEDYFSRTSGFQRLFATKKMGSLYSETDYADRCSIVFGKETVGLPESMLESNLDRCIRIPLRAGARSLNLSNAVAIIAYEALRRHGFPDLVIHP